MADDAEELRTETGDEDGGGPIKSFLEHLEDLRWVLIKSGSFLFVAVVVCLLAGNVVVKVLLHPLHEARSVAGFGKYISESRPVLALRDSAFGKSSYGAWLFRKRSTADPNEPQRISLFFATNQVSTFQLSKEERTLYPFGTNNQVTLRIEPMPFGTNDNLWVLGVRADTNAALGDAADRLNIAIVNLSPAGSFIVAFHVAIYAGIVLSAPFILYFVAAFVFPALRMKEKKYIYRGMFWGLGLFFVGVSFCYFVLMPVALTASVQYSEWLGLTAQQWRAEDYFGFVSKFMRGMGVGFELPVVVLILVKIGILDYKKLAAARRYVIVINFLLGAILTTPEVITQILMAVPMQLLYEITVWIAWWWERKAKKRLAAEEAKGSA